LRLTKFESRQDQHKSNHHTHGWIGVKSLIRCSFPDDDGCNDYTKIIESISHNMNEDGFGAEIVMGMASTMVVTMLRVFVLMVMFMLMTRIVAVRECLLPPFWFLGFDNVAVA
jgi:hypothetical protein